MQLGEINHMHTASVLILAMHVTRIIHIICFPVNMHEQQIPCHAGTPSVCLSTLEQFQILSLCPSKDTGGPK